MPDFRPRGAREVRRAAAAFMEMKARVERSIEQRTAMLAGVSHDLRTILTRFKLEMALIGDSPEVEGMRKDVDEMSGMLEAYLAFARGDSGEQAQPTDMEQALEELRSDAERHGHAATVVFHGQPLVTVKPAAFKRCLANLVSNAARHADAISITGHRDHRYLTVTVDDDGPGIPLAMREEVFKPFLRLDDARNQDEGGTGLGLAIARDIARSHGGDIALGDSPMGGLRATVRGTGLSCRSFTSPRKRGEVGSRSDPGEGLCRFGLFAKFCPSPDPLPARGEREKITSPVPSTASWPPRPRGSAADGGPRGPSGHRGAAAVVPPGEVTFWRSVALSRSERCSNSPEPPRFRARASLRELPADPQRRRRGRVLPRAGTHKRARPRHCCDGIHKRFVIDPFDAAGGAQQRIRDRALLRRDAIRCHRDRNAAPDGGGRVRHGADHLAAADIRNACNGGARHDGHHQSGRPDQ